MVLLKVTDNKVYWTEANVRGYNNIRHYCASPETFINLYDFTYINYVIKNTQYRIPTYPKLDGERNGKGQYRLYWTKTNNTEKYEVYRSTAKKGKYKLVKTTQKYNYTDTTAEKGKRYYYKVKAVKKNGKTYLHFHDGLNNIAVALKNVYDRRDAIRHGVKIVWETELMRHFTVKALFSLIAFVILVALSLIGLSGTFT
jgi:ribosomal protein S4E